MNAFDINAFVALTVGITGKASVEVAEAKKRNDRISVLNTELDLINKTNIPVKKEEIGRITNILTTIDNTISDMKQNNVHNRELMDNLISHRKNGIAGMVVLKKELDILTYRASSMAREKRELTRIARGLVDQEVQAFRTILNEGNVVNHVQFPVVGQAGKLALVNK